jgi:hypothetical protein
MGNSEKKLEQLLYTSISISAPAISLAMYSTAYSRAVVGPTVQSSTVRISTVQSSTAVGRTWTCWSERLGSMLVPDPDMVPKTIF